MDKYKYIVIGGSAGSFQLVSKILEALPVGYPYSIFLTLHRLKHIRTGFVEALAIKSNIKIEEPKDKDAFYPGKAYLAPANYHMLIEPGNNFALSIDEPVNHTRPSIDLTFKSAAYVLKDKLIGILLSGANRDGAIGLKEVQDHGGLTIVQNLDEAQVRTMPEAGLKMAQNSKVMTTDQIIEFLLNIK